MRTIERIWPALLAATFVSSLWAAAAPAAELLDTTTARPATTATATPPKPAPKATTRFATHAPKLPLPRPASIRLETQPVRLASRLNEPARECSSWLSCGGHYLLMLGVAY